jgi:hypothetical protein
VPFAEASARSQGVAPTPTPPGGRTATISEISNVVLSRVNEQLPEGNATVGQIILAGGIVRTLPDSKARIDLSEGTIVRLAPQTAFTVTQLSQDSNNPFTLLRLFTGKVWIILNGGSLDVETPVGVASVRGSLMSTSFDPATGVYKITCLEGTCAVKIGGVTIVMHDNQQTSSVNFTIVKIDEKELLEWSANNPESNKFMPLTSGLNDLQFDNRAPLVPCPTSGTTGASAAGLRIFSTRLSPLMMCASAE